MEDHNRLIRPYTEMHKPRKLYHLLSLCIFLLFKIYPYFLSEMITRKYRVKVSVNMVLASSNGPGYQSEALHISYVLFHF